MASADPIPSATPLLQDLTGLLGAERVLCSPEDQVVYSYDGTAALKCRPAAIVFPRTTQEVAAILGVAARHAVPVVCRGSGTGLSGGSVPVPGGIVLCLLKMNRILEVDERNLTLLVEAGATTLEVAEAAAARDLFYPPDPGSMKISTIGGNVAENSGGLRGLKYGVTRDYVIGLEVVLADGRICWFGGKCVKDVAGFSLRDLFIGSEGTLGVITRVLLKLLPKPAARHTLLAAFTDMGVAAEAVSEIVAARIIPCTLEFLDRRTIQCVEAFARVGLPTEAGALLLIETDGHPVAAREEIERVEGIARGRGAFLVRRAADAAEATQLATARRSAFSALARLRPTTILEDVTVPRSELAKMVRFVEGVAVRHQLQIATFGHFGDGNLHPTILTDERDTAEMHRVEEALKEIFAEALRLGGTITGEHGVGLAKRSFLRAQLGEATYALHQDLKRTLDPLGRLNPGKVIEP